MEFNDMKSSHDQLEAGLVGSDSEKQRLMSQDLDYNESHLDQVKTPRRSASPVWIVLCSLLGCYVLIVALSPMSWSGSVPCLHADLVDQEMSINVPNADAVQTQAEIIEEELMDVIRVEESEKTTLVKLQRRQDDVSNLTTSSTDEDLVTTTAVTIQTTTDQTTPGDRTTETDVSTGMLKPSLGYSICHDNL